MDFAVEIVNYSIGDLQVVDESKSLGGVRVDLSNEVKIGKEVFLK